MISSDKLGTAVKVDPVLLEVMRNELAAITEEMAVTVRRTARSSMLRMGDFATALADRHGRVCGLHGIVVSHTVQFMELMTHVTKKYHGSFMPGDVVVGNDPYHGGSHKPDIYIVVPIFWHGQVEGYALVYSHHADVGGRFRGSMSSQCTNIYEEGVHIPNLKLYDSGIRNEPLAELLRANVRGGDEFLGDLEAKIAGCRRASREFGTVLDKHGPDSITGCYDYMINVGERMMRKSIAELSNGSYTVRSTVRDGGNAFPMNVSLRIRDDTLTVDLTGTAAQAPNAINMPYGNSLGQVLKALHDILCPKVMVNEGLLRPVTIVLPVGTIVNPSPPAAVGGRAPTLFVLNELMHRAMAEAAPDSTPVPGEGGDIIHISCQLEGQDEYATMDLTFGGWGGRPQKDGIDGASHNHYVTTPAELIERELPLVVERFGFVADTGGAGRHRGSLAIEKGYLFRSRASVMVRTNRPQNGAEGLAGGNQGVRSGNLFGTTGGELSELPRESHIHLDVVPGDLIVHRVGGSAGHGDPHEREPALVLEDVLEEKVSIASARELYKVVIDPETMSISYDQTSTLRRTTSVD